MIEYVPAPAPGRVNVAELPDRVDVANTVIPFLKVTVPVREEALEATVAVKVIGTPSLAGLSELTRVVVVLFIFTDTAVVPLLTLPLLMSDAVKVALPAVLLVNDKTFVPSTRAALAGRVSPTALDVTPTVSVVLVARL